MYSSLQMLVKYVKHWLTAANGKGHGIHSPFVFQFVVDIINDDRFFYAFETLELIENKAENNFRKYNQLLFKIANYYQPKKILLLSHSIDNTASYLSAANENALITSVKSTKKNTDFLKENWDMVVLNETDPTLLQNYFKALIRNIHPSSFIAIKNIHGSTAVEVIWDDIKQQPNVTLTIDLFHIGLVFFRQENKVPQHFKIRF